MELQGAIKDSDSERLNWSLGSISVGNSENVPEYMAAEA